MLILEQHDFKCTIFYKIWQPWINKMATIFDQINPDQRFVSVSMLNGFVDRKNICLDANLTCLGAVVYKLQPSQNFLYFGRRTFWKEGKNHIFHARIPWGFFGVDTGTIRNSKLLESVCLQFCLVSPYLWAILTRLGVSVMRNARVCHWLVWFVCSRPAK